MTTPATSTARPTPTLPKWPIVCQAGCVIWAIIAASLGARVSLSTWLILMANCFGIASNYLPPTRTRMKYYLSLGFVLISLLGIVGSVLTRR
jgi:hypothetical protein